MASQISELHRRPPIAGGVKEKADTYLNRDHVRILPGDRATWFGLDVQYGVTNIIQETFWGAEDFQEKWACSWIKNGHRSHIVLDLDVPVQERVTAAVVAMRIEHGNDSEGEGSSPSKTA